MAEAQRDPLAIGLLTHSVNPRGGVVHTLELADALHERGHRVTVFAPALPGQSMFRPTRCELELVPVTARATSVVDMVATRRAAFADHLARTLAGRRFDVLHAQDAIGGNALADLVEAGALDGFVRTVHHLDRFDDARLTAWQERAFTAANQVLCVSRTWCDRLQADFGVPTRLVHNGVDLRRYTSRPAAGDARVLARHGLRPGGPMFLAVGGIEERKNTLRMLQAFLAFRASRPGAQLVIAGGASLLDHDDYGRRFTALLAASGARDDVVITGTVDDADMPALFRAADVLLMASLREGFGLAVLEALASGTPTVVSRIAPFTEYLAAEERAGHCCWADPESADAIAAAMSRACDPAHALALGFATPAVCRRFSWQASASSHEAIYRAHRALARQHAPARSLAREAMPATAPQTPARPRAVSIACQGTPMPAMHFNLRWPDARETRCYSPSLVIKEHFAPGIRYPLPEFMREVRTALHTASERVRAKFGYACSMALDQLATIEEIAATFDDRAEVEVLGFEE